MTNTPDSKLESIKNEIYANGGVRIIETRMVELPECAREMLSGKYEDGKIDKMLDEIHQLISDITSVRLIIPQTSLFFGSAIKFL